MNKIVKGDVNHSANLRQQQKLMFTVSFMPINIISLHAEE